MAHGGQPAAAQGASSVQVTLTSKLLWQFEANTVAPTPADCFAKTVHFAMHWTFTR